MSTIDMTTIHTTVQEITHSYAYQATELVQMLWQVQEKLSYIPTAAIDSFAEILKLPRAYVAGVAGFYSFFRDSPRGQYDIYFSDNIIEHLQGKPQLMDYLLQKLKVEVGKPRADGRVTIDNTACIGMSDQGPAMLVNGYTVTQLTQAKLDKIAELIETQTPLSHWPTEFFQVQDNIQHKHILLGEPLEEGLAIRVMLARGTDATLAEIEKSGLRGCGGAGFKTATKWAFCRNTHADEHYVVCNADEGEPGTFKDRVLLQSYADLVFEGMTVCARIIGAHQGFLYLRGEYRYLLQPLEAVLAKRREQGLLGEQILGNPNFSFDIKIHLGAGAYVCGAELALIESLEGKRGVPRNRPPFPVTQGYLNKPTVVNNVETFALAARIAVYGGDGFAALGTKQSKGTKLLSISGDCLRPGIYEFPFGVSVREVLEACGAQDPQAVQISGAAGTCLSAKEFDRKIAFEDVATGGSVMIFNRQRDLLEVVRNFAHFFVHESCGFCTPCRVGTSLLKNLVEKVYTGHGTAEDLKDMSHISQILKTASHCGLGQTASNHLADTLKKFPEVYRKRLLVEADFEPAFDLDSALEDARQITGRRDEQAYL